jgi:hypothetical protein
MNTLPDLPPPAPKPGVYAGIDYIRAVGPADLYGTALIYLENLFGPWDRSGERARFFEHYVQWANGARFYWGHGSEIVCVDLPGGALSSRFAAAARIDVMRALRAFGFRFTRVDVAFDFVNQGVDLYDHVDASIDAGQLRRTRSVKRVVEKVSGAIKGRTVYLGLRGGDGSGRMVRCYDKGLQTKAFTEPGRWERWEAEFTRGPCMAADAGGANSPVAHQVACKLIDAPDWLPVAIEVAFGAVDFREGKGGDGIGIEDRPRPPWWAELLARVHTVVVYAKRSKARLIGYARWMERSVAPLLGTLAAKAGQSVAVVLEHIVKEWRFSSSSMRSLVVEEYVEWLTERRAAPEVVT